MTRLRSTKPGSRADRIATVVHSASVSGAALTVAELREAYTAATGEGPPKSFTAEVHSLVRRGILVAVGGRTGHTRYAHRDVPLTATVKAEGDDDALMVLRAVRSAYRRVRRPISTREVAEELERLGLRLSTENADGVRKRLEALSTSRSRGHRSWRSAKVLRLSGTAASGGSSNYWLPAGASASAPVAPRSRSDAMRQAIGEAQAALGVPVSRQELSWWIQAQRGRNPVTDAIESNRISEDLYNAIKPDRSHAGEAGRIHLVECDLATHGGALKRYTVNPPSDLDRTFAALDGILVALRPADEREEIAVLERRAAMLRSRALTDFAALRLDALRYAITRHLDTDGAASAVSALGCSLDELERWIRSTDGSRDQLGKRLRHIVERRRQAEAVERVLREYASRRPVRIVGDAALTTADDLSPLLHAAAALIDMEPDRASRLVEAARRFPNLTVDPAERMRDAASQPLSLIDRVDAISLIYGIVSLPRTAALLSSARMLLGGVLRDCADVEALLRTLPPSEAATRRAATVALGLLGVIPDADLAVPDASDAADTNAYILSAIIAEPCSWRLPLQLAKERALGRARSVVNTAQARLSSGLYLSAVE